MPVSVVRKGRTCALQVSISEKPLCCTQRPSASGRTPPCQVPEYFTREQEYTFQANVNTCNVATRHICRISCGTCEQSQAELVLLLLLLLNTPQPFPSLKMHVEPPAFVMLAETLYQAPTHPPPESSNHRSRACRVLRLPSWRHSVG